MQTTVIELERHWTFTPLGIRFWDPVTNAPVRDGLRVTAHSEVPFATPLQAFQTASGLYAFQGLAGLRDLEFSQGAAPGSPPELERYVVEVSDDRRRFLPTAFSLDLPLPYRGAFLNGGLASQASPPGQGLPGFFLFSAPTRLSAPGLSALRASLVERSTGRAVPYALLEVDVGGDSWVGIADAAGQLAVLFPSPTFARNLPASPPFSGEEAAPAQDQVWPVTVRLRFDPGAQSFFDGIRAPDLRSLLTQPPALIWATEAGPPQTEWSGELVFGQELYLRTAGRSELLVEAAGSPP